ncbi:MAG: hypothetical protein AAGF19_03500 [Pseudomonadota bacterium]
MASDDDTKKEDELRRLLSNIPDRRAASIIKALERDRLSGGSALPYSQILNELRPALLRTNNQVARTPTPQRLFCNCFEDILLNGPRKEKQAGRILRSSLDPMWYWLAEHAIADIHREQAQKIAVAILGGNAAAATEETHILCGAAGLAIERRLKGVKPGSPEWRALADQVGSEDAVHDLADMAACLEIAAELAEIRAYFTKPTSHVDQDDVHFVRDIYRTVSDHLPASAPYLLLILAGRLAEPWVAITMASQMSPSQAGVILSKTDLAVVGDVMVDDLERLAEQVVATRHDHFDAERMGYQLNGFARLAKGLTETLGRMSEEEWLKRVRSAKVRVADAVEALLERAPKVVTSALPLSVLSGFGKSTPRRPNLLKKPDPDLHARAVEYVRLLGELQFLANELAISRTQIETTEEIGRFLDKYAEDVLIAIRHARDGEEQEIVFSHFGVALEIVKELRGPEEAQLLQRRGVAASSAAA